MSDTSDNLLLREREEDQNRDEVLIREIPEGPAEGTAADRVEYAGFAPAILLVQEVSTTIDHGNYASQNNPPCMPQGDSRCGSLTAYIPLTAQIDHVELLAKNSGASTWSLCRLNADTPVGWCRFDQLYYQTIPSARAIVAHFKNWSHNLQRDILLRVYYRP
jgi:hypothetical protein